MTSIRDRLVRVLSNLNLNCVRGFEERLDPQFSALEELFKSFRGEVADYLKLVILNAISSYQLKMTGERWWNTFSRVFRDRELGDLLEEYSAFLERYKVRLLPQKLRRVRKLWKALSDLTEGDLRELYEDMLSFRDLVASSLGASQLAKTVVFSVKMFGYASRIAFKRFIPYPMEIDIPVDIRVKRISEVLFGKSLSEAKVISLWREISTESGIPPLHIDSVIWHLWGRRGKLRISDLPKDLISECSEAVLKELLALIGEVKELAN